MEGSRPVHEVNQLALAQVLKHARQYQQGDGGILRILEIGAGSGALSSALHTALESEGLGYEIVCADIEPEQINNSDLGFTCRYLDAQQPFGFEGKFDVVICVELIEHIENLFHFIREVAGITLPGALVILTTPNLFSMRSRLRFFLTGNYDYFRRPYNEHQLNMGHLNPINPLQLIYVLRKNGFNIHKVETNRGAMSSYLLLLFLPFLYLISAFHYLQRERGSGQKQRNRETLRHVLNFGMLTGRNAIFVALREKDIISQPDIWHQPDERFKP